MAIYLYHQKFPWLSSTAAAVVQPSTGKKLGIFIERTLPPSSSVAEGYALIAGLASSDLVMSDTDPITTKSKGRPDSKVLLTCCKKNVEHLTTNPSKVVDGSARQARDISREGRRWELLKTQDSGTPHKAGGFGTRTRRAGLRQSA